jgi:serine/threonine protein kinase
MAQTQTGTPYYCCPEIWLNEPYDSKSDIYSFGCLLYEMCAQVPPHQAKTLE